MCSATLTWRTAEAFEFLKRHPITAEWCSTFTPAEYEIQSRCQSCIFSDHGMVHTPIFVRDERRTIADQRQFPAIGPHAYPSFPSRIPSATKFTIQTYEECQHSSCATSFGVNAQSSAQLGLQSNALPASRQTCKPVTARRAADAAPRQLGATPRPTRIPTSTKIRRLICTHSSAVFALFSIENSTLCYDYERNSSLLGHHVGLLVSIAMALLYLGIW